MLRKLVHIFTRHLEDQVVPVRNLGREHAIVFVHGLMSDPATLWQQFPEILGAFRPEADIFLAGPPKNWRSVLISLEELSQALDALLAGDPLRRYQHLTLITHADAGPAAQIAILNNEYLRARVEHAFFFASPNRGLRLPYERLFRFSLAMLRSGWFGLASNALGVYEKLFPALFELLPGSDFLNALREKWNPVASGRSYWGIAGKNDVLVTFESLTAFARARRVVVEGDHLSIVRPAHPESASAEAVISVLQGRPLPERLLAPAYATFELEDKAAARDFDVFLYYDRADLLAARKLAEQLKQRGIRPWFDEDQVRPSDRPQDLFDSDFEHIRTAVVLIGKSVPGPEDKRIGVIGKFVQHKRRVIPVFLPGARPDAKLPAPFDDTIMSVVLDETDQTGIERLDWGIRDKRPQENMPAIVPPHPGEARPRWQRIAIWAAVVFVAVLGVTYAGWKVYKARIDCGDFSDEAEALVPLPGRSKGFYVKEGHAECVLVFVHGIFGNAQDTWTAPPDTYWPDLVAKDPAFVTTDIYVAAYDTGLTNKMRVDEVADGLNQRLMNAGIFSKHRQVVFLCHSLGGLVVQRLLLMNREYAQRVPFIYFYATPQTGAQIARLGSRFTDDPLLREMAPGARNDYLRLLEADWRHAGFAIKRYCAYEKLQYKCLLVVDEMSATRLCDVTVPMNRNHATIVKPASDTDDPYIALRNAWTATFASTPARQ